MDYLISIRIIRNTSLVLLTLGTLRSLCQSKKRSELILVGYIMLILLMELAAIALPKFLASRGNLFLIDLSALIHFSFIFQIYRLRWNSKIRKYQPVIFSLGALPILWGFGNAPNTAQFQSYASLIYDVAIVCIGFLMVFQTLRIRDGILKHERFLIGMILMCFSFDTLVSLTSNFLINERLHWVAPIWIARAFLFLLFYVSLIHFTWKIGKIPKH